MAATIEITTERAVFVVDVTANWGIVICLGVVVGDVVAEFEILFGVSPGSAVDTLGDIV